MNAGKKWVKEDEELLKEYYNNGEDIQEISKKLERHELSIAYKVCNLELEKNGDEQNKGFLYKMYISPPGIMDANNYTVDPATYYDEGTLDFAGAVMGTLINIDLQTHLLFRIVTRDPDTSSTLQPINIY